MTTYWILGSIVFLWFCVYAITTKKRAIRFSFLLLLAILFLAITFFVSEPITLGVLHWYNATPCREIFLLMTMILGMMTNPIIRTLKDHRVENRKLKKQGGSLKKIMSSLDATDFLLPIFCIIPTFGGLWSQLGDQALSPATIAVAFENGFFWENILRRH
jgi:hypothetical protein